MKIKQHETIRVPYGWSGQEKALIIQLENIFNDLYKLNGQTNSLMVTDVSFDTTTNKLSITIDGNSTDIARLASLDGNGKIPASQLPEATQTSSGLMSATDKTKLDGVAEGATANIGTITSVKVNGQTVSSSGEADIGTVIREHQDISGKADKVSSATSGNFASLDANGNLKDSGHKHSDYITDISGKADKSDTVTNVAYDGTNKKLTKTINGNTTDIVSVSTIKSDLGSFTWGQLANHN